MLITLFATHYENKLMVASRRWRSLVCFLRKEGVEIYIVTPGIENKEYVGEFGETILIFKAKTAKKNAPNNSKIKAKKVIPSPFPYLDISIATWLRVLRDAKVTTACANSDVLISTYGPAGPMLAGLWQAKKHKKPWVLDLRDSFQTPVPFTSKALLKLNLTIEKFITRKAALRLTVGTVLADHLAVKYKQEFEPIYNGWLESDVVDIEVNQEIDRFFLYAGSIYEHQLNALKIFLSGLLIQNSYILRIRLVRDYSGRLDEWLVSNGFNDIVEVYPAMPVEELAVEMRSSVAVVVLEELEPNSWQKGTVTGKLFSLLVSGVPGIVISHPDVELYSLALMGNGWFCAEDKYSAEEAVKSVMKYDRNDLNNNLEIFKKYQFSFQAKKLIKLCEKALNERN
jgi:hypothetical protein